jgi:hypothetical protein
LLFFQTPFLFLSFFDTLQFIAKAFLERDYEALKATSAAPQPIEDVAMSDVNQKIEPDIQHPLTEKVEMDTELEPTMPKSEAAISSQSVPAEIKPDTQSGDDVVVKKESDNAVPDQSFPGPNEDLTFDSVLNDTGGTNDFGLSLDFNDDDMGNQAFLSGSNFTAPVAAGADRLSTQPGNTSDVPAGGGAFDMELQKTEGDDSTFLGQGNSGEDFMGPAESNFDDLFMDTDNFGENGGDFNQLEGDSLMNVNELDDNWFN